MINKLEIRYGKIPGYRNPSRKSWGFALSTEKALGYGQYTCARRSAPRVFKEIEQAAEAQGWEVILTVDPASGLGPNLLPAR